MIIASETKEATVTSGTVVSIDGTEFGFTPGKLADANGAWISCTSNDMNVTWSGEEPTSSMGHPVSKTSSLTSNGPLFIEGKENVARIKLIGLSGSAGATITIGR